ncbi:amidase [Allokutzneria albata]|uniref:Amidase n=1 Tax=Allokutzneria albata TaxID=211114 RepID=A0A1G9SD42_ALLAB|nr:amidase [Allokutzneria albata]SDM33312.1 amidase [Allokutzneria albata]
MSDVHELSAAQQLRALRAGEVSSRELTEHYLTRIDRLDAELGAFVTVVPELALRDAARADERLARGEWSPLCGLPLGLKDLYSTAGIRTTLGSAALAEHVPTEDAWTVGLLRQAGAVILGKTNTAEFGAACYTENDVTARPAVTPYDPARYASGSSGGAAAAVAAGLLPVAHASDGAGSTRTPAATCHLVGVKPSRGLVSSAPASSFLSAGTEGPVARTVADAALLLDVMAQPWPGDLYGWRSTTSFAGAVTRVPDRPLKVAVWTETGLDAVEAHPESVLAVRRTATLLGELGHEVREIVIPANCDEPVRQALKTLFVFSVGITAPTLVPAERRRLLRPYTRHLVSAGESLSAAGVVTAQSVLARYASTFLAALEGFDIALTPTTNGPPVPLGHYFAHGVEGEADLMLGWSCYTPWVNLTGQPAISVPSHVDGEGLPHGVQLVGGQRQDAELLALAAQLEGAALWADVHPPCWYQ